MGYRVTASWALLSVYALFPSRVEGTDYQVVGDRETHSGGPEESALDLPPLLRFPGSASPYRRRISGSSRRDPKVSSKNPAGQSVAGLLLLWLGAEAGCSTTSTPR